MRRSTNVFVAVLVSSAATFSCSDDPSNPSGQGIGGSVDVGAGNTSGGASALGGQAPVGGGGPSGGAPSMGGWVGTGGEQRATGGVTSTGGISSQTGGAVGTGGEQSATGGVTSTGGSPSDSGGSVGPGGSPSDSGGAAGSGGEQSVTGGGPGAGGTTGEAGGEPGAGGTTSETGGEPGMGGNSSGTGGGSSSSGCGSTNTTSPCDARGTTCSLNIEGTERTYYVQLPSSYDASTPHRLIFQFHPWGGSADQALTMYQLNAKIPDAIYVTPQGLDAGGSGPGWANTGGEDIAFTQAMVEDVQSKYCVDNDRIFSTGFSYGGMMSFAIGCEMSDVFRAIAPMSGSLYSDFNCQGTGPAIAMWGSHGISDTVVPLDDGRAALAKILQQNHCGTETTPVDPSPCVMYEGCDPGYEVTWCEWDGPHGIPNFGSEAIAAFFLNF